MKSKYGLKTLKSSLLFTTCHLPITLNVRDPIKMYTFILFFLAIKVRTMIKWMSWHAAAYFDIPKNNIGHALID